MSKIRSAILWYYMFNKRLLKKVSFIIILAIIPVLVFAMRVAMREDSGILKIVICPQNPQDELTGELVQKYLNDEGVINFVRCDDEQEARLMVQNNEADAAWIIQADIEQRIKNSIPNKLKKNAFVTVVEREDNISLKLSREKLFGAVYPYIAYEHFKSFVKREVVNDDTIDETEFHDTFADNFGRTDIFRTVTVNDNAKAKDNINYLNAPLRGLLSLIVMLCGLAAAMYFLQDRMIGKYDWMRKRSQIIPAFGLCAAAVVLSAAAVFAAIYMSGLFTDVWNEVVSMLLYIAAATGFCVLMCVLFKSPGKLGAAMPFLIITMLALCPIFFNVKTMAFVRMCIPTTYYLQAVANHSYRGYSVVYIVCVYAIAAVANFLKSTLKDEAVMI